MSARTNGVSSLRITDQPPSPPADAAKELSKNLAETMIQQAGDATLPKDRSLKIKGVSCDFEGCRKSLSLFDRERKCRCDGIFCARHNFYLNHKCTFDYQKEGKKELQAGVNKEPKPRYWHHQAGGHGFSAY